MALSNKSKEKDPNLAEIENDETPIDDKGKAITPEAETTIEDLLKKNPNELTAVDMDVLSKHKDDLTDEQKVAVGLLDPEVIEEKKDESAFEEESDEADDKKLEEGTALPEEAGKEKKVLPKTPVTEETQEQKDQRYKAQQTEAQIQAERSKAIIDKVEAAESITPPTEDELRTYVAQDGSTWDELTTFEQAQAKRTYLAEKRLQLITEGIKDTQKVDKWAQSVDEFIDSSDGDPDFVDLGPHENDFRKYAMKESHRGTPLDILANAFMYNLPPASKKKDSLFQTGGGGEKVKIQSGIIDADQAAILRTKDPREYKRLIKAGKIKLDV